MNFESVFYSFSISEIIPFLVFLDSTIQCVTLQAHKAIP